MLINKKLYCHNPSKLGNTIIQHKHFAKPYQGTNFSFNFWVYLENVTENACRDSELDSYVEIFTMKDTDDSAEFTLLINQYNSNLKLILSKDKPTATHKFKDKNQQGEVMPVRKRAHTMRDDGELPNAIAFRSAEVLWGRGEWAKAGVQYKVAMRDVDDQYTLVEALPNQKWINLSINIENKYIDVFVDGKLYNAFYSRNIIKFIPHANMKVICSNKGFYGYLSQLRYFNSFINYKRVNTLYKNNIRESGDHDLLWWIK